MLINLACPDASIAFFLGGGGEGRGELKMGRVQRLYFFVTCIWETYIPEAFSNLRKNLLRIGRENPLLKSLIMTSRHNKGAKC